MHVAGMHLVKYPIQQLKDIDHNKILSLSKIAKSTSPGT